jgi:hypothetical protein
MPVVTGECELDEPGISTAIVAGDLRSPKPSAHRPDHGDASQVSRIDALSGHDAAGPLDNSRNTADERRGETNTSTMPPNCDGFLPVQKHQHGATTHIDEHKDSTAEYQRED